MTLQQTTAIVLRTVEFSETSLIVTLLTRDLGRIGAIAKGARRLKSPFEGSLDLLSVCRVVLISKPGDTLDLLTESKLRRRFRAADRSLDRTYAGYYVAEMLRLLLDDDDPHPELFDLTLATLDQIDGTGPLAASLLAFDAQSLRLTGHAPSTRCCTVCGQVVAPERVRTAFSLEGGGVVCRDCRPRQSMLVPISHDALDILDHLIQTPPLDGVPTLFGRSPVFPISNYLFALTPTIAAELRSLLNRYFQTLLGRVPRMQSHVSHFH